ncbi:MAG: nucleoside triphosphate pyrophosphohydrolase [Candidatus Babeliales bacterium]
MRVFKQNKLWRDKAVDIMEQQHGSKIHWRYLSDAEYSEQLRLKLIEEAQEVIATQDRDGLISELADLFEVIDALSTLNNIAKDEIVAAQTSKRDARGGFSGRRFVTRAEHQEGGFGEKYCLADPEKYPEIIEESL